MPATSGRAHGPLEGSNADSLNKLTIDQRRGVTALMSLRPFRSDRMLSAFVLATAILAACTRMPEPVFVPEPRPEPVPLRIGVYNSPELQDFTYKHHLTDIGWVLGKPSVRLLNEALALLFVQVVEVSGPG